MPDITSVPTGFSLGTASTWIGAQNLAGSFVQIGITETGFGTTAAIGTRPPLFEAFWSDTKLGFHPVSIAPVDAGDRISLEMQLQSSGWNLRVEDLRFGWAHDIVTRYAAGQIFNDGGWFQEDPISGDNPLINLPYPDMSATVFSHVQVDGMTPSIGEGDAEAMDVPGGPCLVPTAYDAGSFRVVKAKGFARQYLSDIASYNYAEDQFAYVLGHSPSGHDNEIVSAAGRLVSALDASEDDFASQTWPAVTSSNIESLLSDDYLLSEDLRFIAYGHYNSTRLLMVFHDQDVTAELSSRIRAELGLPPPR